MDFFSLTYGSYPFSNYKVCFVDDLSSDIIDIGSLSICSNRILFPDDIIEPLDRVTRQLVHALASQWMGINIVPKEPADMWVVVGISYFMTDVFMKKLCGNNDFRFRQKQASDRIVELDVARPSLYDTGAIVSLDPLELDFMELKAPLVLFILDRRLTKASGSSGLSRIISRIFLNAKVGDLASSAVYTAYFMKTCEKLGHAKLDVFFAQWIYGAGCPRFRVTQRFNKKKLVVEMLIQQVQTETVERDLEIDGFMRDVKEDIQSVFAGQAQPVFTVRHPSLRIRCPKHVGPDDNPNSRGGRDAVRTYHRDQRSQYQV
jgi:transcription initiation factor TFIID subunit 2